MNIPKFKHLSCALSVALALAAPSALAQSTASFPNKPIRLIVSSGAGGGLDFVARLIATPMSESLGQTVVVDNRPGASGSMAAGMASQSTADGYTLMLMSASLVVYGIVKKTGYDLYRDFAPVSQASASPYILTVHPSMPAKTVKELIAYAKANPSKMNYASTGHASLAHLATELFATTAGIRITHVPYKGIGAALTDLLSGQVQMSFLSPGAVFGQVRSKKLRALAIASTRRAKAAPGLPTMIESGVAGFAVTQWHGVVVPRDAPRQLINRLSQEIHKAVKQPKVAARMARDGTESIGSTPAQFAAHLKAERAQWERVAKIANLLPK